MPHTRRTGPATTVVVPGAARQRGPITAAGLLSLLLPAMLPCGCSENGATGHPTRPLAARDEACLSIGFDRDLARLLEISPGLQSWSWRLETGGEGIESSGRAQLHLFGGEAPRGFWRLRGMPAARPEHGDRPPRVLRLIPGDPTRWHEQLLLWPPPGSAPPPLPRLRVASAYYADLLDLLQRVAAPRFGGRATAWPAYPVPIAAPDSARSGELDLTDCFWEAVKRWNDGGQEPLLLPVALASWEWGVRLVHVAGTCLSPPLQARLVRLDDAGRPVRLHILAGDTYHDERHRPHAVRGLSHELGHALLLWGHSEDRRHLLWRAGPLVDDPSDDERRAVELWRLLPYGLDLYAYGRSGEIDP